jgi:ribonuclease VapC
MSKVVLDASAILAVARNEPGADCVKAERSNSILSTVNHMEVVSKLMQHNILFEDVARFLAEVFPNVTAFDQRQAELAAKLHAANRALSLSYADCACLALGLAMNLPVLTGDRKWSTLVVGVEIRLFR